MLAGKNRTNVRKNRQDTLVWIKLMKIISFNINGIRSRIHQVQKIVEKHRPDIIGFQEIKVRDEDFPAVDLKNLGYDLLFHGQKGYHGVALMYRLPLLESTKGLPGDTEDAQRRLIRADFDYNGKTLRVLNGYFPQGEKRSHPIKFPAKQKFYADLTRLLHDEYDSTTDLVLVVGDMNVAPIDQDIGIGEDNRKRWLKNGKCCFLPEERQWYEELTAWGLHDSYRLLHPHESRTFSWFDYRSRGFERDPRRGLRIDLILVSRSLRSACLEAGIDHEVRAMQKPSDHCPVWLTLA